MVSRTGGRSRATPTWLSAAAVAALVLGSAAAISAAQPAPGETLRVSETATGVGGDGTSAPNDVSADGRFVAFHSWAENLARGDGNEESDVFLADLRTGSVERVSVATNGSEGGDDSIVPTVSDDGRLVAFPSEAENLVPGDSNDAQDVFVRDRAAGTTVAVSVTPQGNTGNEQSEFVDVSGPGAHVAFESFATDLVPGDTNGEWDVFVRDLTTIQTTRVSVASDGAEANGPSFLPFISDDGRRVVFLSNATNLVPGDTNGAMDAFVHDTRTGRTERVSVATDGTQGNADASFPDISADGQRVVFASRASNLVPGDTNGADDVFVRDLTTNTTRLVGAAEGGGTPEAVEGFAIAPRISPDGRWVAYDSTATSVAGAPSDPEADAFLVDLKTGRATIASAPPGGGDANGPTILPVPANGGVVTFASEATNLVASDENGEMDTFVTRVARAGPGAAE